MTRNSALAALAAGAAGLLLLYNRGVLAGDEPGRRFMGVAWDTAWVWTASDSVPLDPFRTVSDGERLYAVDGLNNRVTAFDARSGRILWSTGRRGSGPEELSGPDAVAAVSSGLIVSDPGNMRLARLDTDGRFHEPVPLRNAFPSALCELKDGSLLLPSSFAKTAFLRVDTSGRVLQEIDSPWPDLREGTVSYRVFRLAPTPDGGCIAALELGRGFARFDGSRFLPPHRYVERFDLPEITRGSQMVTLAGGRKVRQFTERVVGTRGGVLGIAVVDSLLAVGFAGETAHRGRVIDFYDWRTGEYRHSCRTPFPVGQMAAAEGTFFFLNETPEGYATILAARPRPRER